MCRLFHLCTLGCQGDSGGPYVCPVKRKEFGTVRGERIWELHGAVSWGSEHCESNVAYSVFARISHFKQWIKDTMASN